MPNKSRTLSVQAFACFNMLVGKSQGFVKLLGQAKKHHNLPKQLGAVCIAMV